MNRYILSPPKKEAPETHFKLKVPSFETGNPNPPSFTVKDAGPKKSLEKERGSETWACRFSGPRLSDGYGSGVFLLERGPWSKGASRGAPKAKGESD